jgi:hypothetical protein
MMSPKAPTKATPAKKTAAKKTAVKKTAPELPEERSYFKQADFPRVTLQQAQKIPSAIVENLMKLVSASSPGRNP